MKKIFKESAKQPKDFIQYTGSKYSSLTDEEEEFVKELEKNLKIELWYSSFSIINKWYVNAKTDLRDLCIFLKSTCGYKLTKEGIEKMVEWLNGSDHSIEAFRDARHAIYYAGKKEIDDWKNSLKIAKFRDISSRNESILKETNGESIKTYSIDYTLNNYIESLMDKSGFKRNSYFVLSLGERSSFYSFKNFIIQAYGKNALDKKPGTYCYFIFFKGMNKEEIIDKLNKLEMFGEYWREDDIVEFDRNGTIYYITRLVFED